MNSAWEAMSEEEKTAWYIKNSADHLEKKDGQDMEHVTETFDEIAADVIVRNRGIPYSVFYEEGLMKGWDKARIENSWKVQILDPAVKKVKFQGQTLLARFEGIVFDERKTTGVVAGVKSTKKLATPEDLRTASEAGEAALSEARALTAAFSASVYSSAWEADSLQIPDELVESLMDWENIVPDMHTLTASLFKSVLEHEARRQTMLESLLQEDMMEASIFVALAGTGEAETDADVAKYRVSRAAEFGKCKDCGCILAVVLQGQHVSVHLASPSVCRRGLGPQLELVRQSLAKLPPKAAPFDNGAIFGGISRQCFLWHELGGVVLISV